mgnify:FL=1
MLTGHRKTPGEGKNMRRLHTMVLLVSLMGSMSGVQSETITVDHERVEKWNKFVQDLYSFHKERIKKQEVSIEERIGGYGGVTNDLEFYREVRYYAKDSGRLLADIKWENRKPDNLHSIELYLYDDKGRISRDYTAAYLPPYRNAPIQTLISIHRYKDGLHSSRQFDVSDNRIFEFCVGQYRGEKVHIVFDDYEIPTMAG